MAHYCWTGEYSQYIIVWVSAVCPLTVCYYFPRCSPGGSSSGTAIAIATGMAPADVGSDTGGSLRISACLCDVVGMRPSKGRWLLEGCVPLVRPDCPGPMVSSVADLAPLDSVICDYEMAKPIDNLSSTKVLVPELWLGGGEHSEISKVRPIFRFAM